MQLQLLGHVGGGRITLMLLEGDRAAVRRFAALEAADLRLSLADSGVINGFPGNLYEVTCRAVRLASTPSVRATG